MSKTNTRSEGLRSELQKLGAREFEIEALAMDPDRGSAALELALNKGATHPISYAIKVFDNPEWSPPAAARQRSVNMHAQPTACPTCEGDRFVTVYRRPVPNRNETIEEMAPCPDCNHQDVSFVRFDGTRAAPPGPERVREMMKKL